MASKENLEAAFAGESQANRRYTSFAQKAEKDGFPNVARLFKAAAHSEAMHARNHLRAMESIQDTLENLKQAVQGENYEVISMYPDFIEEAQREGKQKAETTFKWAIEAEKAHEKFYNQAIEAVNSQKDLDNTPYFVCEGCGYTVAKEAPENCPVCGAPKKMFKQF
jgi:rubrerythrin